MAGARDGAFREMDPGSPFILRLTKDGVRGDGRRGEKRPAYFTLIRPNGLEFDFDTDGGEP
jgi:hypothetical protein